jgi:hypothetical protein
VFVGATWHRALVLRSGLATYAVAISVEAVHVRSDHVHPTGVFRAIAAASPTVDVGRHRHAPGVRRVAVAAFLLGRGGLVRFRGITVIAASRPEGYDQHGAERGLWASPETVEGC